ncbi:nuclear cap-binding protein subunit 1 isoform X1 [Daphnia magna]|uniref:nuclear cap-binding protein subunit 1 isoform X1 n=1 Tax=Daphnia magna TaxID=35525 RepID=UPI001E1BC84C|nr:nuclear cap-binding protein subunit 1 isoform X1 [Daphnia magna]
MSRRKRDDGYEHGYRKRRRVVSEQAEIEDRLESLIIRVGDKTSSSLESNLEGLASVLEADMNTYKSKILRILSECPIQMPEKCTIYSTLVGLLNAKNYNFGGEFVEQMVRNLKEALREGQWESARLIVRFISDMVNCHIVSASSLLQLYDSFIDAAMEQGVPQVRRDWYMYALLTALPWVGRELFEKKENDLERIMAAMEGYLRRRNTAHVAALRVWNCDTPHPQEEYLECIWAQVRKLRTDEWQERHIYRPYLAFDSILSEALQHNLPVILPPPHTASTQYPLPWVVFRMFDYTDCPEAGPLLPGTHSVERYLIEEHLHQIVTRHHNERKELATQLLAFPQRNKIPLEYMIVEVLFSELFNMPSPRYLEISYGCTLIELCKLQPSTMPQVLAQATELLYERIDTMNATCFDRFVSWFSYHLSNFQFRWSWDDWQNCLSLEKDHPKAKFVSEVFGKCLRLSYYKRVNEMVPECYSPLLPPKPEPYFKYQTEGGNGLPGATQVQALTELLRKKPTPEEVLELIQQLPNPLKDDDGDMEPSHNPLAIEVFVQTLLHLGSKSFTHTFAGLAKYHSVFKTICENEEAQICMLRQVYELWQNHPQFLGVVVDKMLKTQIVECCAVANWIFSRDMAPEFTRSYIWEILHLTIRKMNKHVVRLEKEVADARAKLRAAPSDSESSDDDPNREAGEKRRRTISNKDTPKDGEEQPTEEMVERMEERLEAAQSDQKNLFLIVFQRFIMILSEHVVRCDTDGKDFNTFWYQWTVGRLQQVFMAHHEQVEKYSQTLETLLFTHDLDSNILDTFRQFQALRS